MLELLGAVDPWVETAVVLAAFWIAYWLATRSWRFWHLAIGRDGRYSTSLFQGLAWTLIVLASYLAIWFARIRLGSTAALGPVPQNVLAAMGLSLATTAVAAGITSHRVRTGRDVRRHAVRGENTLGALLKDDRGKPNLAKSQLMAWTAVALGIYLVSAADAVGKTMAAHSLDGLPTLPDIEPTLLLLMGIGQGAYLAVKAASAPDVSADSAAGAPGDADAATSTAAVISPSGNPTTSAAVAISGDPATADSSSAVAASSAAIPTSADPVAADPTSAVPAATTTIAAVVSTAVPALAPLAHLIATAEPAAGPGVDAAVAGAAANPGSVRVPGFMPSVNGLHFTNAWPHEPDLTITLPGVGTLPIGDAANGLCGGMVYTVRDVFQTPGLAPLTTTDNPEPDTPLYRYIVTRLLESFDVGHLGFARYYEWMVTPDADAAVGTTLVRRGLAWKTIVEEWATSIRPELDAGRLVCLGLVTVAGPDPRLLGENHQVLAYGYDLAADGELSLLIYDPNTAPGQADGVRVSLSVLHPDVETPITHNVGIDHPIRGFFHTSYTYHDPTGQLG